MDGEPETVGRAIQPKRFPQSSSFERKMESSAKFFPTRKANLLLDSSIFPDLNPNINYYLSDVVPIQYVPRKDIFKYDLAIGDAVINSKQKDVAPAWKVVVLNGEITSTERKFKLDPNSPTGSEAHIPQVNIRVQYEKEIKHQN